MTLGDTGESRVRGYLFVLERSLRASASAPLASDAVREVESHIRERVAESDGLPNEREALERILQKLGTPSTVARAYSLEMILDEAAVGGRFASVVHSVFQTAAIGTGSFVLSFLLFTGYAMGVSLLLMAVLKPIFPNNVGLWLHEGISFGAQFPAPPGVTPLGGYWIIPISLVLGMALLTMTHRLARRRAHVVRERLRTERAQ